MASRSSFRERVSRSATSLTFEGGGVQAVAQFCMHAMSSTARLDLTCDPQAGSLFPTTYSPTLFAIAISLSLETHLKALACFLTTKS